MPRGNKVKQQKSSGGDKMYHLFKIVLVGDSGVGKSNLMSRFTKNEFDIHTTSTVGVEFESRTVQMQDDQWVKLQVWDTAGQERFKAVTTAYYRNAYGAVLVYDITSRNSFLNVTKWLGEIRDYANREVQLHMVGNKLDLVMENPSARQVTVEEAKAKAEELGVFYSEVSAKNDGKQFKEAVDEVFLGMAKRLYRIFVLKRGSDDEDEEEAASSNVDLSSGGGEKKGCC